MLKVDNKKTIRNLANKSFKASRTRNIVAVIAIALTTILFTSVFTMGIGTVESLQMATMRQAGGDGHAMLKYITDEEFEAVKNHKSIDRIAYNRILCDGVQNEEFLKRHAEFWYNDKVGLELGFIELKEGRLPQKE
ncbi:MAG: ABC transporter permease, partial [Oscillospiraceae bacterium]